MKIKTFELCVELVTLRLMAHICFWWSFFSSLLPISCGPPTSGNFSFDSSENSCVRRPTDLTNRSAGSARRLAG